MQLNFELGPAPCYTYSHQYYKQFIWSLNYFLSPTAERKWKCYWRERNKNPWTPEPERKLPGHWKHLSGKHSVPKANYPGSGEQIKSVWICGRERRDCTYYIPKTKSRTAAKNTRPGIKTQVNQWIISYW